METAARPAVLTEQYPEIAPHIEQLPEHVVDHLGEIALQLSHADMYANKEIEGSYGEKVQRIDFEANITDTDYDRSQLEAEAVEAAEQGKQKLADVLTGSAKLLGEAHTELTEQGAVFGTEVLETDEARDMREATERDTIYERALSNAIQKASEAKNRGNTEQAISAVESLIILRHIQQGERSWGEKDRTALRSLVRAGLTDELVQGAQTASKLVIGTDYENVGDSLYDARLLLQCATGKNIDSQFKPTTNIEHFHIQTTSEEDLRDIMAVMATDGAALTPEQGFDSMSYSTVMITVKAKINPNAARGENGSLSYFDAFLEKGDTSENIVKAMEFEDPMLCLDVMEKLGIADAWRIEQSLGSKESYDSPIVINQPIVEGMVELKTAYPEQFDLLVDKYYDYKFSGFTETGKNPASIKAGLDTLSELGIADGEFLKILMNQENIEVFSLSIKNIAAACNRQNISLDTLKHQSEKGRIKFSNVLKAAHENPDNLEIMLSDVLLQAEIVDEYRNLLEGLTFPLPEKYPKVNTEKLELIQGRLEALTIPSDVAKVIVKSWGTYSAFHKHMYRDNGWEIPTEPLEKTAVDRIVADQLTAYTEQLKSIESFAEIYGPEVLLEVISTFGIYNFSRHKPEKLVEQLERWKTGEMAKTVVVDARSDWNSYSAKAVTFEEETGDGVFYFEA